MSFKTIHELMSQSRALTESQDPLHNPQFNDDAKDVKDMAQTDTTEVVSKLEEDTTPGTVSTDPAKPQEVGVTQDKYKPTDDGKSAFLKEEDAAEDEDVKEVEVIDTDLDIDAEADKEKVYLGKYVARDPITGEAFFVDTADKMQVAPSGEDEVECEIIGKVVSLEDASKAEEEVTEEDDEDEKLECTMKEDVNITADCVTVNAESDSEEAVEVPAPVEVDFDESAFNKLLAKHVSESYKNVAKVGITKGELVRSGKQVRLRLEGKVVLKNGKVKPMRFMSEAFNPSKKGLIRFGMSSKLFSESKNSFSCTALIKESVITPRVLNANYKVKKSGKIYECVGRYTLK